MGRRMTFLLHVGRRRAVACFAFPLRLFSLSDLPREFYGI